MEVVYVENTVFAVRMWVLNRITTIKSNEENPIELLSGLTPGAVPSRGSRVRPSWLMMYLGMSVFTPTLA